MKKENFTEQRVIAYKCAPGKQQTIFWDAKAPGLGLRVTAAGSKSYVFETQLYGGTIRVTIGNAGAWPLESELCKEKDVATGERAEIRRGARQEAQRLKAMTDQGIDPRQAEKEAQVARHTRQAAEKAHALRQTLTFAEVWAVYLAARKPYWGERHYQDHVTKFAAGGVPSQRGTRGRGVTIAGPLYFFADKPISAIDAEMVEAWAKREGATRPTSARLAWRMLKVFFQWCYECKEYADMLPRLNPGKTKKSREALGRAKAKRDTLELAQLPGWFAAVRNIGNPTIAAYLQALLLTGARPGEVLEMCWQDINWQWESIIIRDKIDGERTIPLTPYVAQLLHTLPRRNEYVFASAVEGVQIIGKPHLMHNNACSAAGLQGLTLHGLRRSFASLAEQTETPAGVAAQIQGHKPQSAREKSYIVRPLDFLRKWHIRIEAWMLEQAGINFVPAKPGLKLVG